MGSTPRPTDPSTPNPPNPMKGSIDWKSIKEHSIRAIEGDERDTGSLLFASLAGFTRYWECVPASIDARKTVKWSAVDRVLPWNQAAKFPFKYNILYCSILCYLKTLHRSTPTQISPFHEKPPKYLHHSFVSCSPLCHGRPLPPLGFKC